MSQQQRNNFKLGLAILMMTGLGFAATLFISGQDLFKEAQVSLRVLFKPHSGMPELKEGAYVVYLGQRVGTVVQLDFWEPTTDDGSASQSTADPLPQYLEVIASVNESIGLRRDCQVALTGPPLGGGGKLEIIHRGKASELHSPEDSLFGTMTGFGSILEQAGQELSADNPDGMLALIKAQFDPQNNESMLFRVNESLADVNQFTDRELSPDDSENLVGKLHGGLGAFRDMGVDNKDTVKSIVDDASETTVAVKEGALKLRDTLNRELELQPGEGEITLLTKLHQTMSNLKTTTQNAGLFTGDLKKTMVLNKDHITEIMQNAASASYNIKQFTLSALLNPATLLMGPSASDRRERILFSTARAYAEAAARLDLTTARLKSLLESDIEAIPEDDPALLKIRTELQATMERFSEAEHALLQELNIPSPSAADQVSTPPK